MLLLLAFSLYLPLFFVNVAWFLPLALQPRGMLSEFLVSWLPSRKTLADAANDGSSQKRHQCPKGVEDLEPMQPTIRRQYRLGR